MSNKIYASNNQMENYHHSLSSLKEELMNDFNVHEEYDTIEIWEAELQNPYQLSDLMDYGFFIECMESYSVDVFGENEVLKKTFSELYDNKELKKEIGNLLNKTKIPEFKEIRNIKSKFIQLNKNIE